MIKFSLKKIIKHCKYKYRFSSYGKKTLISAIEALNSAKVTFWIDFGTLLGFYRDNGFIKGDRDIDLSMFLDDYDENTKEKMSKYGFKLLKTYLVKDGEKIYGMEQTYRFKKIHLDIFYYSKHNEKLYKTHTFIGFNNMSMTKSMKFYKGVRVIEQYLPISSFKEVEYFGHSVLAPADIPLHLEYHYGKDFMTPRSWDYTNTIKDNINAIFLEEKLGELYFK